MRVLIYYKSYSADARFAMNIAYDYYKSDPRNKDYPICHFMVSDVDTIKHLKLYKDDIIVIIGLRLTANTITYLAKNNPKEVVWIDNMKSSWLMYDSFQSRKNKGVVYRNLNLTGYVQECRVPLTRMTLEHYLERINEPIYDKRFISIINQMIGYTSISELYSGIHNLVSPVNINTINTMDPLYIWNTYLKDMDIFKYGKESDRNDSNLISFAEYNNSSNHLYTSIDKYYYELYKVLLPINMIVICDKYEFRNAIVVNSTIDMPVLVRALSKYCPYLTHDAIIIRWYKEDDKYYYDIIDNKIQRQYLVAKMPNIISNISKIFSLKYNYSWDFAEASFTSDMLYFNNNKDIFIRNRPFFLPKYKYIKKYN